MCCLVMQTVREQEAQQTWQAVQEKKLSDILSASDSVYPIVRTGSATACVTLVLQFLICYCKRPALEADLLF